MQVTMYYPGEGYPNTLPPYVAAVLFETLLYGVYLVLFGTCMFLLIRRRKSSQLVLLVFATLMFTIASVDIIYTFYLMFVGILKLGLTYNDLRPKYVLYVTNFVADTLLIYRCYMIWGSNLYIVIGPAITLVLATASGYILEAVSYSLSRHSWIYLATNLALNITITSLNVGRIWWVHSATCLLLNKGVSRRYKIAIYIFIESGIIYSVYIVLALSLRGVSTAFAILDSGLIQIVGVMPTLILVQSELTHATKDVDSAMVASASDYETIQGSAASHPSPSNYTHVEMGVWRSRGNPLNLVMPATFHNVFTSTPSFLHS